MRKLVICSALVMAITAASAQAQVTKTVQGEAKTVTVTVEGIEKSTRTVSVKKADGTFEAFYVPDGMKAFDTLKIGDKITAKYYENLVLRLKPAGEKDADSAAVAVVPNAGRTAGTASHQQTITATITAIDEKTPSITFTGPRGWKYSTRVEDRKALAKVKVGDKVDITWTEAMILSIEPGK